MLYNKNDQRNLKELPMNEGGKYILFERMKEWGGNERMINERQKKDNENNNIGRIKWK